MSTTEEIGSKVDPLAAAQARAVKDETFNALFKQAGKAGAILGVGTNGKAATAFFMTIADEIARPALVILKRRDQKDGKDGSAELPTLEAAPTLLLELCGLVNHAVEQAQTEARKSAILRMKAAEMSKAAKNARNAIVTRLDRALAPHGLTVNFSAGTCALSDAPAVKTDAEKACDRVVSAFALSVRGALDGVAALDAQAYAFLSGAVAHRNAVMAAESADENASALQAIADELAAKAKAAAPGVRQIEEAAAKKAAQDAADARARADKLAADLKAA